MCRSSRVLRQDVRPRQRQEREAVTTHRQDLPHRDHHRRSGYPETGQVQSGSQRLRHGRHPGYADVLHALRLLMGHRLSKNRRENFPRQKGQH